MKNTFKISWCIIFLFLSVILIGQKRYMLSFQTEIGIIGLEGKEKSQNDYYSYLKTTSPNYDYSIGINNHLYFSKKRTIGISLGVLYNRYSFKRKYESSSNYPDINYERIQEGSFQFNSKNILIPLRLIVEKKRFNYFCGFNYNFHFSTKVNHEGFKIQFEPIESYLEWDLEMEESDYFEDYNGLPYRVKLDRKNSFQYVLGFGFKVNSMARINFNFKSFIIPSNLVQTRISFANELIVSPPINRNITSNSLSIDLNWRIF